VRCSVIRNLRFLIGSKIAARFLNACIPVKRAFPPGRAGRFNAEHRVPLHGSVFSLLDTAIRVRRVVRDVADWFGGHRICHHAASQSEALVRSNSSSITPLTA
jgi:hypothetical protein